MTMDKSFAAGNPGTSGAGTATAAAPSQTLDLAITGMSCASCVMRVEKALAAVPGVVSASVNLATEQARVAVGRGVDAMPLIAAIEKAGYDARLLEAETGGMDALAERQRLEMNALSAALWLAAALTLPVFLLEMGSHFIPAFHHFIDSTLGRQNNWYLQFALTTAVLLFPGRRFFTAGLPALMRGAPDMNSLVAVGAGAAYLYSIVATFAPGLLPAQTVNVYYEAAAVIATLILLGRYLEMRAKGRTSEAIKRLLRLQPATARVMRDDGYVELPVADVRPGDTLQLRPGERVPVDGTVTEGSSYVDESMITGEPIPNRKEAGAEVVAGTVNQNGALTMQATRTGSDTVLARIIRMVEQAQASKLPIQAMVDRITLWFVPAVMAAAALTFLVWMAWGPSPALSFALVNAVAVLIIACPCAMGLATPTSIMVGTGRAAQLGVLIRKGDALQSLRDARVVAIDKTGTLTEGKPTLGDIVLAPGADRDRILALVAAAETRSEHPIAQAIVRAAREQGLPLADAQAFETDVGAGIRATVQGVRVEVGAARYMRSLGIGIDRFGAAVDAGGEGGLGPGSAPQRGIHDNGVQDAVALTEQAQHFSEEGKTPVYAALDGQLVALITVTDPVKPSAAPAVRALHALGLKVAMITGDDARTAHAIARQLGIDDVVAEVMPEGKVEQVKRLRERYGTLAFVGDGINDAPALAEAEIGIAIGTGTDIAVEAADVVLMSGDMQGVVNAIDLSHATLANIRQNLFWAFAYNTALIPLAAGALYPAAGILLSPIFAAGAMALSSVFVLTNALRLRRYAPPAAV
ncbi:heavy metal translocating P-type ATPase [Pusillimonas sp. TS35]|nr:heavy metal translocating P-type ATPase [Pusillimonas sp. TS35]